MNDKKKDFCGFEPTKVHREFIDFTNAFQMRFDVISNTICNKGDFILKGKYSNFTLSLMLRKIESSKMFEEKCIFIFRLLIIINSIWILDAKLISWYTVNDVTS